MTWSVVMFNVMSYKKLMIAFAPEKMQEKIDELMSIFVRIWLLVMAGLVIFHVVRSVKKLKALRF